MDNARENAIVNRYGMQAINLEDIPDEDRELLEATFFLLANFCARTRNARFYRKQGLIAKALELEAEADHYYKSLPDSLKW